MIVRVIPLFAFTLIAVVKADIDWKVSDEYYCGKHLSCNGTPNVMCGKRTVFGPDCVDPIYIRIDPHLQRKFLNTHNELRNQQAMGEKGNILKPPVADMATMQWDDELELLSLVNAMQCKLAKDECHRTAAYERVGQNVYELCTSLNYTPVRNAIDIAIRSWFDEHHGIADLSEEHLVEDSSLAKSGQFLQVIKSNCDRIGCSVIEYLDERNYRCTVVGCNYNAGSIVDVPTYFIGPTASRCTTGANPKYPGLCSEKEDYTKHEYADTFYSNTSTPIVEWVKRNKKIDVGGTIVNYKKSQ